MVSNPHKHVCLERRVVYWPWGSRCGQLVARAEAVGPGDAPLPEDKDKLCRCPRPWDIVAQHLRVMVVPVGREGVRSPSSSYTMCTKALGSREAFLPSWRLPEAAS